MTVEEYRQCQAAAMSEAELQEYVRTLCKDLNLLYYHTHRSQHSPSGFPDCVIVTADERLIFAELKRQDKDPTPAQEEWLDALSEVAVWVHSGSGPIEVHTWKPLDALDGTIESIVRGEHS